jgi:hypothetical protein
MKLNWGKSIVLAFALFISFILYFIIKVQSNSKYDNELVIEEYYKHDAHYSDEFAKIQNAENITDKPQITITNDGVLISYSKAFIAERIKGKVSLYRPSASQMDFERSLQLSDNAMLIPRVEFADGNWDLTLSWTYEGKEYITKQKLYI